MKSQLGVRYKSVVPHAFTIFWTWACCFAAGLSFAADVARATDIGGPAVRVTIVEIGWGGTFKVGEWTSLRLTATAKSDLYATLVVETPDADDQVTVLPAAPVRLQKGVPTRLETCFKSGRINGELQIRLENDAGEVLHTEVIRPEAKQESLLQPALRVEVPVWGVLGQPAGFDEIVTATRENDRRESGETISPQIVRCNTIENLPQDWRGYQSLTALVIATAKSSPDQPSLLKAIIPEHDAALREWVRHGGHLVLSIASETAAFAESPFAKWFPVNIVGETTRRQLSGLEIFAGRNARLTFAGTVTAAKLAPIDAGNVLVKELDESLVVQVPYGFGRVTVLALDADRPPLAKWAGMPAFWKKLLGDDERLAVQQGTRTTGQLSQLGMTDLATQLHAAQEEFPAVQRPSNWWVMGLILLYMLAIGPLDYLIVHRLLRRPEWTWFTLPLWIIIAGGASVWGANRLNGNAVLVNQLDLVDVDAATQSLRGRAWITVYSPETRRYAVGVEPAGFVTADVPARLSWNGIPENTVGGLYRAGGLAVTGRGYRYQTESTGLENIPIQKWSAKELSAEWHGQATELVTNTLENAGPGRLKGSVAHQLPVPLEECVLVYGGRLFTLGTQRDQLGTLAPHQEWEPVNGQQRDLKAFLTGTTAIRVEKGTNKNLQSEIQFKAEPYNPLNHDRGDLLRMISFHDVAGGTTYTGLQNAAQRELELTPLMSLGRAILLGRVKHSAARLKIDNMPHDPADHLTYVRIVLPVKPAKSVNENFVPNKVIR